jgi:hypothetical protein
MAMRGNAPCVHHYFIVIIIIVIIINLACLLVVFPTQMTPHRTRR